MYGQYIWCLEPYLTDRTLNPFVMLIIGFEFASFDTVGTFKVGTSILL
jgi:hypothetical protein